ncbi:MAG: pilus assembly protein PilM [bacterium]
MNFKLKRIKNKFNFKLKIKNLKFKITAIRSFAYSRRVITGIEIGQNSIKVVQGIPEWRKSGMKIIALLTEEVKSNDEKREKLQHIISNLDIKPKKVIACIPRSLVTVRYLNLPSISEREIAHMVQFQAEKQLPYSKEEIVTAFRVVESNKDGYSRVMLVLVHRDVINKQLELLGDMKLNPEYIELSSQAAAYAFIKEHPEINKLVAFVDIDMFSVDVQVIFNGKLVYTRNISLSENRTQESLLEGITKSLNSYLGERRIEEDRRIKQDSNYKGEEKRKLKDRRLRMERTKSPSANGHDKDISSIFISGNVQPDLIDKLSNAFHTTVEAFNLMNRLPVNEKILSSVDEYQCSICSIVGLVSNFPEAVLNLLPDEIKTQKQIRKKRKHYLVLASQCASILLLILGIFMRNIYDKQNTLKWLDIEIKKTNPIAKEVNKRTNRLRVIKKQIDTKNSSLDILHELHKIIPDTVSLSTLDYQLNNTLKIKGQSKALSDALGLIDILEKSSYFKNVQLKSSNMRRLRNMEVADFYIQCEIENRE